MMVAIYTHTLLNSIQIIAQYYYIVGCCSIMYTPLYVWLGLTQRVTSGPHDLSTSTACAWLNPSRLLPLTERISSPRESTPSVEEEQMSNMCMYVSRRSTGMEQYVHRQLYKHLHDVYTPNATYVYLPPSLSRTYLSFLTCTMHTIINNT